MESLVLCGSSVQQNTGSTNKSLTYQRHETITVLQKEYKLSLDQMDIKKTKTKTKTHKYNSVATAYVQNLKAHQDPTSFLQLYGVVSLALHCNENFQWHSPYLQQHITCKHRANILYRKSVFAAKSDERKKEMLFFFLFFF